MIFRQSSSALSLLSFCSLMACATFLTGCLSVRPGSVKSARNLHETFFVGEEGTQYFIKPLGFESAADKNTTLTADFTFRYKDQVRDSAIINFTITAADLYRSAESLTISNPSFSAPCHSTDLLYNQRSAKGFVSRFSARLPMSDLIRLFESPNWSVDLSAGGVPMTFLASKKSRRSLIRLEDGVFVVFREG